MLPELTEPYNYSTCKCSVPLQWQPKANGTTLRPFFVKASSASTSSHRSGYKTHIACQFIRPLFSHFCRSSVQFLILVERGLEVNFNTVTVYWAGMPPILLENHWMRWHRSRDGGAWLTQHHSWTGIIYPFNRLISWSYSAWEPIHVHTIRSGFSITPSAR